MSDLVRREDVIREFVKNCSIEHVDINNVAIFYETIMKIINSIPSVEPERKKGEWKPFDRTWGRSIYHCTACGKAEDCPTEMGRVIWQFCPNCGAKLDWSDNE